MNEQLKKLNEAYENLKKDHYSLKEANLSLHHTMKTLLENDEGNNPLVKSMISNLSYDETSIADIIKERYSNENKTDNQFFESNINSENECINNYDECLINDECEKKICSWTLNHETDQCLDIDKKNQKMLLNAKKNLIFGVTAEQLRATVKTVTVKCKDIIEEVSESGLDKSAEFKSKQSST